MEYMIQYKDAVRTIKTAILQAQYDAAKGINRIQLGMYFAVGKYLSLNTRKGKWGSNALQTISDQLRKELPGLRGFSADSLKLMRIFYEEQEVLDNNSLISIHEFKPSHLGQLTTYLRILDDKVRKPHENPTIGIVLCKSANRDFVEYVIQDYEKPMGVATYSTNNDMPENLRNALPNVEELRKLLNVNR